MITIQQIQTHGFESAIRGMRNPLNSWALSDSTVQEDGSVLAGPKDYSLMTRLNKAGTDHRKYMRMMIVTMDITAPLYWWKEFDTYKIGTVANSCSTMHKIHAKPFTIDDFSHDHIYDGVGDVTDYGEGSLEPTDILKITVDALNSLRTEYLANGKDKRVWYTMIQLLPSSYNQKRTVMLNYEVLANMHKSRKNHKLDEWREFCEIVANELPYSELITGEC